MFNISFFLNNTKNNRSIIISKKFLFIFKFKRLRSNLKKSGGKTNNGTYTIFSKGSSKFNHYNLINFSREQLKLPSILVGNSFDNFKFCYYGVVKFLNGSFSQILLPHKLNIGKLLLSTNTSFKFISSLGSCKPLYAIKPFEKIFNIVDITRTKSGYSRSAGTFSQILRRRGGLILVKLPSGKNKLFSEFSLATIGQASNIYKNTEIISRFGYKKKIGWKSKVRGVAKNPCDHPHGGTTKGGKPKMNPWGRIFK